MSILSGINKQVTAPFTVFDLDGITPVAGLVDGDFSKVLRHESTASALPVVISEVGGGDYVATFTPDALGHWYLRVVDPYDAHRGCSVQVSEDDIGEASTLVRKYVVNGQRVDFGTQELVILDDDLSDLQRHDLETDGGEPVSTHPGVQTIRGPRKL